MKEFSALLVFAVLIVVLALEGRTHSATPPAASDNPLAGLNLSDGGASSGPALTGFGAMVGRKLITAEDGRAKPFDPAALQGVKYLAIYYSASWCPPCRAFTPKLVEFYKAFKPLHPNFELIFVNEDQSEDAMLAYMKGDGMTWPAVRFDDIDRTGAKKYGGPGIPDLVLVDENGKVLADSFNGSDYRGPEAVMDEIESLVR